MGANEEQTLYPEDLRHGGRQTGTLWQAELVFIHYLNLSSNNCTYPQII